jgi:hypothetical protein
MKSGLKYKSQNAVTTFTVTLVAFAIIRIISGIPYIQAQEDSGNGGNIAIFPSDSEPYGLTYSEWTAKWVQWVFSMPEEDNPAVDDTGENCANNQSGPVWFLAGTFGGAVSRECTISSSEGIMVPIINAICDSATDPSLDTEEELRACARADQDLVIEKEVTVDGISIGNLDDYRFQSPLFDLTFPENNIAGIAPQTAQAIADGYWILLEPLPPGSHEIHFKAALGDPTAIGTINFALDVKYLLTVEGERIEVAPATETVNNQSITLQGLSTSGKFNVEIVWTPNDIGQENIFDIKIADTDGNQLDNTTYDIIFFKEDLPLNETHRADQTVAQQTYNFSEPGDYLLRIGNINSSGEDLINIPINVVPEFQVGIVAIMMAIMFTAIIFVNRSRIRSL